MKKYFIPSTEVVTLAASAVILSGSPDGPGSSPAEVGPGTEAPPGVDFD